MVKDDCKQRDLTDLDIHQATDMTPIRCLVTVEVSPVIGPYMTGHRSASRSLVIGEAAYVRTPMPVAPGHAMLRLTGSGDATTDLRVLPGGVASFIFTTLE